MENVDFKISNDIYQQMQKIPMNAYIVYQL